MRQIIFSFLLLSTVAEIARAEPSEQEKAEIKQYLIYQSKYLDPDSTIVDMDSTRKEVAVAVEKLRQKIHYLNKDTERIGVYLKTWKGIQYNPYRQKTKWLKPAQRQQMFNDCCRARKDQSFAESRLLQIEKHRAERKLEIIRNTGIPPTEE